MKNWTKIFIIAVVGLALTFNLVYIFLFFQGKPILTRKLSEATGRKATIASFGLTPPLNFQIRGLNIDGLLKVGSLYASLSVIRILTGKVAFNNIRLVNPEFSFRREARQVAAREAGPGAPAVSLTQPEVEKAKAPAAAGRLPNFLIKRLKIIDGKINFTDTTGSQEINILVDDLNFNLRNLFAFPSSTITSFSLNANIPWQEGQQEGRIEAEGWVNFTKKDMQASLKIKNIDAVYLYPYYSNWVDLEGARIQSARLNFASDLISLNNDLTVSYSLELMDIVRRPLTEGEAEKKAARITDRVLEAFKALDTGNIVLRHSFKTKMDNPQFGINNIKLAFEDKLALARGSGFKTEEVFMVPANLLQGLFKGATHLSRVVVVGAIEMGNEIKKSAEQALNKGPQKPPAENKEGTKTEK